VWYENNNKKGSKKKGNKEKIDIIPAGGEPAVLFCTAPTSLFL